MVDKEDLPKNICGRCYEETDELFPSGCNEDPEKFKGQPLGMYHCPDCGAMVMAGVKHPSLCIQCVERKHPDFD